MLTEMTTAEITEFIARERELLAKARRLGIRDAIKASRRAIADAETELLNR